jgi:hypothetical protein
MTHQAHLPHFGYLSSAESIFSSVLGGLSFEKTESQILLSGLPSFFHRSISSNMRLKKGHHLAYCTNIHAGESWGAVFAALQTHTLAVRERIAPRQPYAIGLRLGAQAARDLADPTTLLTFQRWLEAHDCYVFTINGFPYGPFHGTRVKEDVYRPDWTTPERLDYTCLLFDLLSQIVPPGVDGSVSSLPLSCKAFDLSTTAYDLMRQQLSTCARHIEKCAARSGRRLHLGLEPEPFCTLETTQEFIDFFRPAAAELRHYIGINYDTCHLALQYETAATSLAALREAGHFVSKFHLSSALRLQPTPEALARLQAFDEPTYLHQVIIRPAVGGPLSRFLDLPAALQHVASSPPASGDEWRVHFHVPVHPHPERLFSDTTDHLLDVIDVLALQPDLCSHLEIETYTWQVLPPALRTVDVTDQIEKEYHYILSELARRGLA